MNEIPAHRRYNDHVVRITAHRVAPENPAPLVIAIREAIAEAENVETLTAKLHALELTDRHVDRITRTFAEEPVGTDRLYGGIPYISTRASRLRVGDRIPGWDDRTDKVSCRIVTGVDHDFAIEGNSVLVTFDGTTEHGAAVTMRYAYASPVNVAAEIPAAEASSRVAAAAVDASIKLAHTINGPDYATLPPLESQLLERNSHHEQLLNSQRPRERFLRHRHGR